MSQLSLEIRFALALTAAVSAIECCTVGVLTDDELAYVNLDTQFDWSTIDAYIELAYIAKAIYSKEISDSIGYLRAGRCGAIAPLTEKQVLESAKIQTNAFRTAVELGKKEGIISEADLLAVFRPIGIETDLYLTTRTAVSHLPLLVRHVLESQRFSNFQLDVKTMTTIFVSTMIFNGKPKAPIVIPGQGIMNT